MGRKFRGLSGLGLDKSGKDTNEEEMLDIDTSYVGYWHRPNTPFPALFLTSFKQMCHLAVNRKAPLCLIHTRYLI